MASAFDTLSEAGLAKRRQTLGGDYVRSALDAADNEQLAAFQRFVTNACWDFAWRRDGLADRDRSLLCIGMMVALGRAFELEKHVKAALGNGLSPDEVLEAILFTVPYCGIPATLDAFVIARSAMAHEEGTEADR